MPPNYHQRGLLSWDQGRALPGFTLYSPTGMPHTWLVNMKGQEVHSWRIPSAPGNYGYLLENGNLLIANRTDEGPQRLPAKGGQLLELDWDGNVVWEHIDHCQHHDFRRLPNGNTVYAAWRLLSVDEHRLVKGGLPGTEHEDGIYGDVIREITPDGEIVWEWDAIRDNDPEAWPLYPGSWRREYAHCNTVSPCANGDMIINQRMNGRMSIIDRQTKAIRWSLAKFEFGQQHDVQELANGNLLFFANDATSTSFHGPEVGSRVIEINPTTNEVVWSFSGSPSTSFFSWFVSGCQRLDNGNTLICEGAFGRIFEVTPSGEIVWDYAQPHQADNPKAPYHQSYTLFRAYRYDANSPELRGRAGKAD